MRDDIHSDRRKAALPLLAVQSLPVFLRKSDCSITLKNLSSYLFPITFNNLSWVITSSHIAVESLMFWERRAFIFGPCELEVRFAPPKSWLGPDDLINIYPTHIGQVSLGVFLCQGHSVL